MTCPKSGAGVCSYKKHRHKSFEGPEMVKKKIPPVLRARPGGGNLASLCQRGVVRGPSPVSLILLGVQTRRA